MSTLFSPLHLKNHTLHNRIVVSPMCQYTAEDGFANNWHLVHLGQYAIGRAAAIIQEATAVCPEGRITFGDLGIWKDGHIEKLSEINHFIKSQGTIPGIQLSHAGRKASTNKPWINRNQFNPNEENGWQTVAPSAIGFNETDNLPIELTIEAIEKIIIQFKEAAKRAVKAGYEIIEIHGAHGYLAHQFFSPLTNLRKDIYGGSFENRVRFILEVVDAVKSELTTQSLWVRLSATDWADGGWTCFETVELCQILKEKGVEVMDISTGGLVRHQEIPVSKNYQVPFAARVKKETNAITGAVGLIDSGNQAEEILQNNEADLIFVAREFLRNPHFVYQAAIDLGEEIPWAPQYERGKE
ncbi:NADH:flavin oxidoreductase/NADH oxidase [Flavobacterium sp. I3-2]|uniref:NADH:flavin oxidoreductase/NADH oxidase n=1 Tax=Flavobacterium sp. I3-2 TaxID=2748319 RepID=UPI0015B203FB|nr:NADH:flavin oxidoreductase/NADH oxidase [Flavobacterium sp. I3-2]